MSIRIFIDMDGTIADIHGQDNWYERMGKEDNFFETLEPFNNLIAALVLIKYQYGKNVEFFSLSAVENNNKNTVSVISKFKWINNFADFIKKKNRIFTEIGKPKTDYIKNISIKDILLDDFSKNLEDWSEKGGTAIKVKNNINCSSINKNRLVIYNQDSIYNIVEILSETIDSLLK